MFARLAHSSLVDNCSDQERSVGYEPQFLAKKSRHQRAMFPLPSSSISRRPCKPSLRRSHLRSARKDESSLSVTSYLNYSHFWPTDRTLDPWLTTVLPRLQFPAYLRRNPRVRRTPSVSYSLRFANPSSKSRKYSLNITSRNEATRHDRSYIHPPNYSD